MRKLGKATMAAVLSTAMVMGNVGGNAPFSWNMQQVKADLEEVSSEVRSSLRFTQRWVLSVRIPFLFSVW